MQRASLARLNFVNKRNIHPQDHLRASAYAFSATHAAGHRMAKVWIVAIFVISAFQITVEILWLAPLRAEAETPIPSPQRNGQGCYIPICTLCFTPQIYKNGRSWAHALGSNQSLDPSRIAVAVDYDETAWFPATNLGTRNFLFRS